MDPNIFNRRRYENPFVRATICPSPVRDVQMNVLVYGKNHPKPAGPLEDSDT